VSQTAAKHSAEAPAPPNHFDLIISQPSSLAFFVLNRALPDLPLSFAHIGRFAMTVNRENSESTTADLPDFAPATGGTMRYSCPQASPVSLPAREE
jgi:hypothetical protein